MAVVGALAAMFCLLNSTILGIKVVGKVALCALAGTFVLTVLFLVRSVTLSGAGTGYLFLFTPNLNGLLKDQVWIDAFRLVYLNLTFAFWPMAGLASHNRFHNNCFLDSALLISAALFAPLLLSISIFCCYGFFAEMLGVSLYEVIEPGVKLWFVVMPEICSQLPSSNVWCVIWFGLLCLTLLGTQMGFCISVVSSILDLLGWVHGWRQAIPVTVILCLFIFVSTVVGIFVGSSYLRILDEGFVYLQIVPIALFCIGVVWLYGGLQKFYLMRFAKDVESMVGFFPIFFKGLFTAMWGFVTPCLMAAYLLEEFIYNWTHLTKPTLIFMGVCLLVLIIGAILGGLHEVWKHKDVNTYFTDYFFRASLPLPNWGPALEDHRSYAGYLPTGFTPQPYRIGQRPYLPNVEDPQPPVGKPEMDTATLPAATPLLGLNLVSTETTL
ncbi:putative sodium- and chloride-dependent glycine transporter 1 isoform X2 [Apostichopus japonicus]|uniref:Putative sodium-and chloride-dependent glycine transporter 1 isoform X2 n=1 Tax=Stichopus japonicus TaxID=307972 RepID=A0A2G8K8Q3_STIJA|nr:putative sodium- and chloride-dependent glycine transporter 1 isoform X2 [Apostichopus japonicus]